MIEIIHPGLLSIIVDRGRFGFSHIGVPYSSCLDDFAYESLKYLTDNYDSPPVIEIIGSGFSIKFHNNLYCAITGARVEATLEDEICPIWKTFRAKKGEVLRVRSVIDGFRYYLGFSGIMDIEEVMGSFTTNMECAFGGYYGRALKKGDVIRFKKLKDIEEREIDNIFIPSLSSPHVLRVIDGPEIDFFLEDSIKTIFEKREKPCYKVSIKSNRVGIRLEGDPFKFKGHVEKSIVSEGILPGTIQVPGDGLPLIMLYERTIGGYARLANVIKADLYRLAHLKPGDDVMFERISMDEAENLWHKRCVLTNTLFKK